MRDPQRPAVASAPRNLYRITVNFACGGIVVENGRVVQAAPIFGWMRGHHMDSVNKYVADKHGAIHVVEEY